ncbi:cytidyltransferase [Alteribacillus sp. YIM 98480]|uniref:cytidyltransferase n=1 Tax=Alteribacillus sp. YIM 98480 TaxID=2606599 RepID=UPI00131B3A2C|nr:cytidyltransferase [Alteribacillus sp. YIM 98480]
MEVVYLEYPENYILPSGINSSVLALGFFDGVHVGHKEILNVAKRIATVKKLDFAVMTFHPHPSQVINKNKQSRINHYLTPLSVKKEILQDMGVDKLYIINFNLPFSKLSYKEFMDIFISGVNAKHVVAGFDFKYGYKGLGNMKQLAADGKGKFEVTTVSKVEQHHQKISSTLIRQFLSSGHVHKIRDYLGNDYEIMGNIRDLITVTNNNHQGDLLILSIKDEYLMPVTGMYKIEVDIDHQRYAGVCTIPFKSENGYLEVLLNDRIKRNDILDENIKIIWKEQIETIRVSI